MNRWIKAARLRTLPIALSSIAVGGMLASVTPGFDPWVLGLAILTTVFLQILSNFANDYGDYISGVDLKDRVGPERALQSGAITKEAMKKALYVMGALSFLSGLTLLALAYANGLETEAFVFLALGIGAIAAAINYTVGKNPYGYSGFGDLFVFIFFGLVGVGGSFFLASSGIWDWSLLMPASAIGLLSSAVLNLNNMRDAEKDEQAGKRTLVVQVGLANAKRYHLVLLFLPFVLMAIFFFQNEVSIEHHFYIVALPMMGRNGLTVIKTPDPARLDPELKKVAIGTFLFSLLAGLGWILEYS